MGLLDAIANPTLADIPAAFEKRDKKQAMDMAGEILGSTVQGKLGALFNKDPDLAMKVAKATGTPTDSEGRMNHLIGTIKFANQLVKGGMPGEAGIILTEGAEKINAVAPGQAEKMRGMGAAVGQGDTEALNNLNTLDVSFSGQAVSAKEAAETGKLEAETGKIRAETDELTNRQPADEKTGLELERLRLQIANENASAEARKVKASEAVQQKDSTAIAKAFDSLSAIEAVDSLLADNGYKNIYGLADQFIPTILPSAVGQEAQRDLLIGLLSLESRAKLKGQGTISDSETKILGQSATILGNPGIKAKTSITDPAIGHYILSESGLVAPAWRVLD